MSNAGWFGGKIDPMCTLTSPIWFAGHGVTDVSDGCGQNVCE